MSAKIFFWISIGFLSRLPQAPFPWLRPPVALPCPYPYVVVGPSPVSLSILSPSPCHVMPCHQRPVRSCHVMSCHSLHSQPAYLASYLILSYLILTSTNTHSEPHPVNPLLFSFLILFAAQLNIHHPSVHNLSPPPSLSHTHKVLRIQVPTSQPTNQPTNQPSPAQPSPGTEVEGFCILRVRVT